MDRFVCCLSLKSHAQLSLLVDLVCKNNIRTSEMSDLEAQWQAPMLHLKPTGKN